MAIKLFSAALHGLNCNTIEVQVDISAGMPMFCIVGLGDTSIQESKERVRSSIKNSGYKYPSNHKTINLAPAEIKKQGSLFDLPIALGLLMESEQIKTFDLSNSMFAGELALNGAVKSINGALLIAHHAKQNGFKRLFLPKSNACEAAFVRGIEIYPIENLIQLIDFLSGEISITTQPHISFSEYKKDFVEKENLSNFLDIHGQAKAKRALLISLAGGHNIAFFGSPGCGKTLLACACKDLLSEMDDEEIFQCTKIYSVAGMVSEKHPAIFTRPFRQVHHTASLASIIGGGANKISPGEISLAHNGVLFMDEIAQFQSQVLDCLRQPLEDKFIHINRLKFSAKFPCNFTLIATMNPCPCGYKGDKKVKCKCTDAQIKNYKKKISGPIVDRFDMFIEMVKEPLNNIFKENEKEKLEQLNIMILKITRAQKIQMERFKGLKNIKKNSDMNMAEIKKFCLINDENLDFLNKAKENMNLTNRGYFKILKLARTIADIENSKDISKDHLSEALQYRQTNY
ncbi:MAG: YifB family Mg chelatase-like AAA ATPase [Candidatus Gracilibacteria bacterium]|jgi:magnesium chelatase family protein